MSNFDRTVSIRIFCVHFAMESNDDSSDPVIRFKLVSKIGRGAYAEVYKAWDEAEEKIVAIKSIDLEDVDDDMEYIHKEIAVMSNLCRPQLIDYFSSYVVDSSLWIIMEYLEAGSLADMIKEGGPLDEQSIAYIMKELLMVLTQFCLHNVAEK